jgi:hypothetical protein
VNGAAGTSTTGGAGGSNGGAIGGNGGGLGQAGSKGSASFGVIAAGGAAGKCININSYTVTKLGAGSYLGATS